MILVPDFFEDQMIVPKFYHISSVLESVGTFYVLHDIQSQPTCTYNYYTVYQYTMLVVNWPIRLQIARLMNNLSTSNTRFDKLFNRVQAIHIFMYNMFTLPSCGYDIVDLHVKACYIPLMVAMTVMTYGLRSTV